jgi:hypothetical protein
MLQLQRSAKDGNCLICHVFFAASEPIIASVDQTLLSGFAVIAEEGRATISVVSYKDDTKIENTISRSKTEYYSYDKDKKGIKHEAIISLYADKGKCTLYSKRHCFLCIVRS